MRVAAFSMRSNTNDRMRVAAFITKTVRSIDKCSVCSYRSLAYITRTFQSAKALQEATVMKRFG
jgi:hypothetical protein